MSKNISVNITAHGSTVINVLDSGTFNSNQQLQPTEIVQQQKKDIDPTLELEHSRDEESDEEDKIPSDLSIHHHPYRTCEDSTSSVSKYFPTKVHTMLKPTLSFDTYHPTRGLNCYDWCLDIEVSPPADWTSSLTLCTQSLVKACGSKNLLDMHTAQVLTQILPVLINGPPDDSNEDSFVHYYLSPLLSSVFASDPLLKMKWANGQLIKNNNAAFKPDFLVYNISDSVKCVILIAEFKPTEQNSYVESDLIKLSKQMKDTLNKLVIKGVTKPRICGIHCEGENVHTYVMDLPSPKLYRIINASKIKLFKNLDQMSLLPNIITHLLC
ncbi:hypothetical protein K501DRAFT_251935 [Backusella circina FSU 941]|nr:hypothetical protein K501DRAFT_251935 [Backusella circina FSU 941]